MTVFNFQEGIKVKQYLLDFKQKNNKIHKKG